MKLTVIAFPIKSDDIACCNAPLLWIKQNNANTFKKLAKNCSSHKVFLEKSHVAEKYATMINFLIEIPVSQAEKKMVVSGFNVDLLQMDLKTLDNHAQLGDEVINFFNSLLLYDMEKWDLEDDKMPNVPVKVLICSSFAFSSFQALGIDVAYPLTKKRFKFGFTEKVLLPIHLGNHWIAGEMDMKSKRVTVFDSFPNDKNSHLKVRQVTFNALIYPLEIARLFVLFNGKGFS